MANDITKAISGNPLKNGTLVVSCGVQGFPDSPATIVYDKNILNTPTIENIQSKYDNRFDDPSYYYGIGNSGIIGV